MTQEGTLKLQALLRLLVRDKRIKFDGPQFLIEQDAYRPELDIN